MSHTAACRAANPDPLFSAAPYQCCCAAAPTRVPNPCYGAALVEVEVPTTHYQVRKVFAPSVTQLAAYAASQSHAVPQTRETDPETGERAGRATFDDDAVRSLCLQYPKDALYPLIEGYRMLDKARGTYISKMRQGAGLVHADGRLRDRYRHTPKTLRLAMELLQVLPRPVRLAAGETLAPDDPRRVYDAIRRCIVPAHGHEFVACDFSGIEPLLVAYLAKDPAYLRACRLGSHSWITSHVIGRPVDIMGASDEDVLGQLAELAAGGPYVVNGVSRPWKAIRDGCKTAHMASLYAGGPGEIARANPALFPTTREARYIQDAIFSVIPSVPRWHWDTARQCEQQQYLTAPSGFRLWGYQLIDTRWSEAKGQWVERLTRTAKELIAAVPQHCGMMYTAAATLALGRERPDLAQWLRLLIHDEIFCEVPQEMAEDLLTTLRTLMERPHPKMPLWPEAQAVMGGATHLAVGVEHKRSADSWGAMA